MGKYMRKGIKGVEKMQEVCHPSSNSPLGVRLTRARSLAMLKENCAGASAAALVSTVNSTSARHGGLQLAQPPHSPHFPHQTPSLPPQSPSSSLHHMQLRSRKQQQLLLDSTAAAALQRNKTKKSSNSILCKQQQAEVVDSAARDSSACCSRIAKKQLEVAEVANSRVSSSCNIALCSSSSRASAAVPINQNCNGASFTTSNSASMASFVSSRRVMVANTYSNNNNSRTCTRRRPVTRSQAHILQASPPFQEEDTVSVGSQGISLDCSTTNHHPYAPEIEPGFGESPAMIAGREAAKAAIVEPRQQHNTETIAEACDRDSVSCCFVRDESEAVNSKATVPPCCCGNDHAPDFAMACSCSRRPRSAPPFGNSSRRQTTNTNYFCDIPSSGEIEAFLATAEQKERRRFMDRYNFDPLTERPFRGRYEWRNDQLM